VVVIVAVAVVAAAVVIAAAAVIANSAINAGYFAFSFCQQPRPSRIRLGLFAGTLPVGFRVECYRPERYCPGRPNRVSLAMALPAFRERLLPSVTGLLAGLASNGRWLPGVAPMYPAEAIPEKAMESQLRQGRV
jgi:hypothetical protein